MTDTGNISLLVLLDLSAAFDTVDHNILLSVLSNRFSLNSTALRWLESYLTDRTQYFTYAGEQTSSYLVDCSVPQCSVLGHAASCPIPRILSMCLSSTLYSHTYTPTTRSFMTAVDLTTLAHFAGACRIAQLTSVLGVSRATCN